MRILFLNRRDTVNPLGGGAEIYTHEMAKRLVANGDEVDLFTMAFPDCAKEEVIDGIRHIRAGSEFGVHYRGFIYAFKHRRHYDLIVDEFNGIGFGGFLFRKGMLLIHQMYREFWFRELGILGALPYIIEPINLWLYRKQPAITVSRSTATDLEAIGFNNVHIVKNAIEALPVDETVTKEPDPTLLFLSRLRSTKKPEDAIRIYQRVKKSVPNLKLWFVGRGPEEEKLHALAADDRDITFLGFVEEAKKYEIYKRAHIIVVPGVREGWGMNVTEAASQGTPAVGYNVPGLRDSIRDKKTGLLASGIEDAAEKVLMLLNDKELYAQYSSNCIEDVKQFNWHNRAEEFRKIIEGLERR
ncbi:glycosyltransferase family 4 protein [Nitrospirota bacterium]